MKIIALGAAFIGIGYGLLPFGRGYGYAAFTVMVWTMGEILTIPMTATVTANRAGASTGRYMGMLSLMFSLAWFIAPFSGNWLYAKIGGDALWKLAGGIGLLTAGGIWLLRSALPVVNLHVHRARKTAPAHRNIIRGSQRRPTRCGGGRKHLLVLLIVALAHCPRRRSAGQRLLSPPAMRAA